MSFTNIEGGNYDMEIQMDSWEKLNRKPRYEELLSYAADGHDIEIILPKKCKDRSKEMDSREHIYAEAMEKRHAVQKEGRNKFAIKRWLRSFTNVKDDIILRVPGIFAAYMGFSVIGAIMGVASFGLYASFEMLNFMTKQESYDRIIKNFEKPEKSLDLKFRYTDKPYEMRNKILLPHDSLDKLRENRPEAYDELKKLMDGKCILQKYDFVEEFGEKHPEAFEELKMVALEQEPYDYNLHTRRMK